MCREAPMIVQAYAPIFHVTQLEAALDFYVGTLGCRETFRVGSYAGLELGPLRLHLAARDEVAGEHRPIGGGSLYIFCDSVEALFEHLAASGATLLRRPEDSHYGMREMAIADPDGNMLVFGMEMP